MDYGGRREGTLSAALWTTMKAVLPDMGAASLSHPGTLPETRSPKGGSATRVRNHTWSFSCETETINCDNFHASAQ